MKNKMKVFLVGNDLNSLRTYKRETRDSVNNRFSFCLNGTISLHHLEQMPEVIFLNCSRNDLFGLNLLRKIRKTHPSTHIIIVVSPDHIKIARHALNRGAFAYIVKGENEGQQINSIMEMIGTLHKAPVLPASSVFEKLWSLLPLPDKFFFPRKLVSGHR